MDCSEEKLKVIYALAEIHGKDLSEPAAKLYGYALREYTDEQVRQAGNKLLATTKFFPKPVEIIEAITGGEEVAKINGELALDEALKTVRLTGCYKNPVFEDPLIPAVIQNRFGGWPKFCLCDMNTFARRDFVEEYNMLAKNKDQHQVRQLIGRHEQENKKLLSRKPEQISNLIDLN